MSKVSIKAPKRGLPATHPGEILREEVLPALKARGVGKVDVAAGLRISRSALEKLVKEEMNVSPDMALRLSRYLGTSPEVWLNLQQAWDLERARERLADELAEITPAPAA